LRTERAGPVAPPSLGHVVPSLALVALLTAVSLELLAYRLACSAFDSLVMPVWALLALCTYRPMRASPLALQRVWWLALLLYPCWESGLKWPINWNVIASSWAWLNRLELLGWMLSLLLLLPAYRRVWTFGWPLATLFVLDLGASIGNPNGFREYAVWLQAGAAGRGVLCSDTIPDPLTNVPGNVPGNVSGTVLACVIGARLLAASAVRPRPSAPG
jgi:hypothetical protein